MISKEKRKKLHQMLDLVIDINNTNANAFISFSGHVNGVQVDVHKDGWKAYDGPELEKMIFLKGKEKLRECNDLIKELKKIKEELNNVK